MEGPKFDLKLISEFDGSASGLPVFECIEMLELVCRLCGGKSLEHGIHLRLTGGDYLDLDDKAEFDIDHIKSTFVIAFARDSFMVYKQLMKRRYTWLS